MDQESKEEMRSMCGGEEKRLSHTIKLLENISVLPGKLAGIRRSWWIIVMATVSTVARAQES